MKVTKLNNLFQESNAVQLARTIYRTKVLPPDITKDYANKVLTENSKKLSLETLAGITGIAASFALLANSMDAPNILKDMCATVLLFSSTVFSLAKSNINKIVNKAQDILNIGKEIK